MAPVRGGPAGAFRRYVGRELTVRIRGLDGGGDVQIHIEHQSGAALIVPLCRRVARERGPELSTTGFDGTGFTLTLDEPSRSLEIVASAPTPILGGGTRVTLDNGEDVVPAVSRTTRVSGDEDTMPIDLERDAST